MPRDFIITKEHRRFKEFATAVRKEKTIGICHGEAGVGKTLSARRYAHWDEVGTFVDEWGPRSAADAKVQATAHRSRTVFYTPEVLPRHKQIMNEIGHLQTRVGFCIDEHLRTIGKVTGVHVGNVAKLVELVIIDEAERLTPTALELLRDEHDRHELAIIFIGMPGIDQRFRHGRLHRRPSRRRYRENHARQLSFARTSLPPGQASHEDQSTRDHHRRCRRGRREYPRHR